MQRQGENGGDNTTACLPSHLSSLDGPVPPEATGDRACVMHRRAENGLRGAEQHRWEAGGRRSPSSGLDLVTSFVRDCKQVAPPFSIFLSISKWGE